MPDSAGDQKSFVAEVLTFGFGTSVAMWGVGYVGRIPGSPVPSAVVGTAMLACVVAGGFAAGRAGSRGIRGGVLAGLIAAVLNLLVLGSLLSGTRPGQVSPAAWLWVPGSLLATAALSGTGAVLGGLGRRASAAPRNWPGLFAIVAAGATLMLVIAGGVVTSDRAGLAVVDWPNSFGYNMFLFPISRMMGGVFLEHAHRLLGSLVGITTVSLALVVFVFDSRPWLKRLSLLAVVAVIVQGILGGLRVTGHFTMAADPSRTAPSIGLAVAHGVMGQLFFGLVVAMSVFLSGTWRSGAAPRQRPSVPTDRALSAGLVGLLLVQLVLGAVQRHLERGLMIHVSLAIFVILLVVTCGSRAAGLYPDVPAIRRTGVVLSAAVTLQAVLGMLALVAVGMEQDAGGPAAWQVAVRTAHQAVGALLLASAVSLALWTRRLVEAE